jgi:hypothetical protein
MRRFVLVLAFVGMASPALAQDDDDAPAAPSPAAHHKASAEKPADKKPEEAVPGTDTSQHCAPPESLTKDQANAYLAACSFFTGIANREPSRVIHSCRAPFYFEGKPVSSADEIARRWTQLLGELQDTRANFYGLEILSYDDMVKKYGKPPAKLDNVPLRGATLAVGNLDGYANIIALKKDGPLWTVFAFQD